MRGPCYTAWSEEIPSVLFHQGSKHNHIPQTVNSNHQQTIASLSQQLQCIMLHILQYSVCMLNKPGLDLYIVDYLSCHSNTNNRNQEIAGLSISIHTLSTSLAIPVGASIENIRAALSEDAELQMLQAHIIRG